MSKTSNDIDYLSEDPIINNQKLVLMSFLPPKEVDELEFTIPIREVLSEIIKSQIKSIVKTCLTDNENAETVILANLNEAIIPKVEEYQKKWRKSTEKGLWGAVKVRGVFDDDKDGTDKAKERCVQLQKYDKNFNIYMGKVGCWLPFNPPSEAINNQEYAEKELNNLMKNRLKNKIEAENLEKNRQLEMQEEHLKKELQKEK